MTWTAATSQAETWTEEAQLPTRVFSPLVFSRANFAGKRVFAYGTTAGIWDARTKQAETWTAE